MEDSPDVAALDLSALLCTKHETVISVVLTLVLKAAACSTLRGKPSTKKYLLPCFTCQTRYSSKISCTMLFGTNSPSSMRSSIMALCVASGNLAEPRKRSPTETC